MDMQNYPPDLALLIEQHGHLCIGSLIGYRLTKYALKLVDKGPGLTVATGSGGCLLHAIKILTECSREKGNIIHMEERGWGFYDQSSGEGYRFTLKNEQLELMGGNRDNLMKALLTLPDNEIFNLEAFDLPEIEGK